LVSLHVGSNTYFYITDRLGSVRALARVDDFGVVSGIVNRYQYNAWGEILSQTESVAQPFKFAGAEHDSFNGLYKMGARYYDPAVGRFTQPDPLGGGYQYVLNNPVNLVDPSGYCGEEDTVIWTDEGSVSIIAHPSCTTLDNPPDNPPQAYATGGVLPGNFGGSASGAAPQNVPDIHIPDIGRPYIAPNKLPFANYTARNTGPGRVGAPGLAAALTASFMAGFILGQYCDIHCVGEFWAQTLRGR
jgi:RHS repeat-associated protein